MIFLAQIYWLLRRQLFVMQDSFGDTVVNYVFIWPFLWAMTNGHFVPATCFAGMDVTRKGTELVLGMVFMQMMVSTFFPLVTLLGEREESKVLSYHVMATSFAATFFSRLLFYIAFTSVIMLPFFPMIKVFLGAQFYTEELSWAALMGLMCLASAMVTSYGFCILGLVKTVHDVEYAWSYGIEPFLWLSGLWAPVYAIAKSGVPGITWVLRFNPFAYMTDAVRQLFFHQASFASLAQCLAVMTFATLSFIIAAYWLLKRQMKVV